MRKLPFPRWAAVPLVILLCVLLLFSAERFARAAVMRRLVEVEPRAAIRSVSWGMNAILIRGLHLPGRGLYADSAWVLIQGFPFKPQPVEIVLSGVVLTLEAQEDQGNGSPGPQLPTISILEGRIPTDGTSLFARRNGEEDLLSMQGSWGSAVLRRAGAEFFAVFHRCSGFPLALVNLPPAFRGRTVSGMCSGVVSEGVLIEGMITEIDGRPASALFRYESCGENVQAELKLDFSQVAPVALALLEDYTGGVVTSSSPSGSLFVSLGSADSLSFQTLLHFDSILVDGRGISQEAFYSSATLYGRGFVLPESSALHVDSGFLAVKDASVNYTLTASWGAERRMLLHIHNDSLPGEHITASIPDAVMGRLRGLSLTGHLALDCWLLLDWDHPDSCDISLNVDASRLQVAWSPVSLGGLQRPSGATATMRDSWGNTATVGLDTLSNPDFVMFESLPFYFEALLCCAEDATFRRHGGFSEYHIRNSIRADMSVGRLVRGGSTISMQLAKNLFLGREKTFARKLQEVFLTWRLERWLTKDRILEIYANLVELGPGVFGFDSASLYYFGKPVTEASVREMAFLVSILPGPGIYHRYGVVGVVPPHWSAYIDRLIRICGNRGLIPEPLVAEALAESLVFHGPVSLLRVDNRQHMGY